MIKPAKCPKLHCETSPSINYVDGRWNCFCPYSGEDDPIFTSRILAAAILRWNLWAWRERVKMRKESGK